MAQALTRDSSPAATSAWVGLAALASVFLHLWFYNTLGFHRDELLYFSLGQHPAFGYASVPPLTGWLAWLMIKLAGSNLFAARLLPALFSGLLVILASAVAGELKGNSYSRILAAVGVLIFPINLRGFHLFEPVFMDVFLWTLIFWLSLRFINTQKDRYLLLTGVIFGIGFLNKYLILILLVALVLSFALTRQRTVFRRRPLYIAGAIALVIALPNIVWQIRHGFPVLTHMEALNESQLVHVNRIEFLTDQLFICFLSVVLIIPGITWLAFHRDARPYRAPAIAAFLSFAILWALRGKNYYVAGIYPFLVAAGAVFWGERIRRKSLRAVFALSLVLLTLPFAPMAIPVFGKEHLAKYFSRITRYTGMDVVLRDERGNFHSLPQDYADMTGWDELAAIAGKAWQSLPDRRDAAIYCENYGQAGAITVLGPKYGLPRPLCFSESFNYWNPKDFPVEITTMIYINDDMGDDVKSLFRDIRVAGSIRDTLARECGTTVWICSDPVVSFNGFWREVVKVKTNPFD